MRGVFEQVPHRTRPAVLERRVPGQRALETWASEQGTPSEAPEVSTVEGENREAGREHVPGEVVAGGQQLRMYLQEEEALEERRRQLENQVPAGVGRAGCGKKETLSHRRQRGGK